MSGTTALISGGGAVGTDFHLPRLIRLRHMSEISVVEVDARRRADLTAKLRGRNKVRLLSAMPANSDFDIGVIATPPRFHASYVEELTSCCAKLLIEKPLAHDLGDAEAIVASLSHAPTQAFVCHIRRALGSFALVRVLEQRGTFGRLHKVRLNEGGVFSWKATSIGSFSRELNGGGVLQDTGPHAIDLLYQVFDTLTLRRAWMDADLQHGCRAIEANCALQLQSDDGVVVELNLSRNRNLSNKACFEFETATLVVDVRDNTMALHLAEDCGMRGVAFGGPPQKLEYHELFDAFYARFVVAGDNRGVTVTDALRVARLIDAAYRPSEPMTGGF